MRLISAAVSAALLCLTIGAGAAWAQTVAPGDAPGGGVALRATGLPTTNLPVIAGQGGRVTAGTVPAAGLPAAGINPTGVPSPAAAAPAGTALGNYPPGTAFAVDAYGRLTLATPGFTPAAPNFGNPAYYVATGGNDTNAGTIQAPFLTLGQCQTRMEQSATFTGAITSGTTTLTVSGVTGTIAIGQVITTGANILGDVIVSGSGTTWTVATAPTTTITSEVMATTSPKSCYVRAGRYVLPSGGLHLTSADTNQVWSCYPPDGIGACILDGASLGASTFLIQTDTGATGVTFNGFVMLDGSYIIVFSQANNAVWTNNVFDGNKANPWYGLDIYGNNALIAGNTFQNLGNGTGNATNAVGILGNSTGLTHSLVFNNTIQCITGFGINLLGGGNGNVFAYNYVTGIGDSGASPPSCLGINGNNSGTGIEDVGGTGELLMFNNVQNTQGYAVAIVGQSKGGGNVVSDNYLAPYSDPALDFIGGNYAASGCSNPNPCTNPNGVIRRNTMVSPGSAGINLGDENDTCNGSTTTRQGTANNALVANNYIAAAFEPIYVTASQNSIFQGNVLNDAVGTNAGTAPHYQSGLSIVAWAADGGASCVVQQQNTGNMIQLNSINSNNTYPTCGNCSPTNSKYGLLFEANQAPNTAQFNVVYPFGTSGIGAIQNNSGGTITDVNNQKATTPQPFAGAPPITDAGPSELVLSGQANVTLNGAGSRNFPGGGQATGVTYAWTQISGTAVTLSSVASPTPSFTAPTVTQTTILGFKLTVSNAFGSTYDQVYVGVVPAI
jgi:hypothetical protein